MEKKEHDETKPEDGLSRRRFVKQVAAWGAAALALYAPPQLRSLALAADAPRSRKSRRAPGRDKLLLLDKDPAVDKDPNADKDPNEKDPGEKAPGEKDRARRTPQPRNKLRVHSSSEQPGPPRRYAGPGPDEWGPKA